MPDSSAALFIGFVVTALYFFAGALVFPDHVDGLETLDGYFAKEKSKVIGALLAANTIAYATRPLIMGARSWSWMAWFDWATQALFYLCGLLALASRRRGVVIACLAALVTLDLLDPVESVLWPN
jgi:hypothetical protein